jgi:hypothetical protein
MFVAREQVRVAPYVSNFTDRTGLAARSSSIYSSATINDISDADDLASQAFTPSVLSTLTPGEVGAQFFITDSRMESDPMMVRNDAALELGAAMASKIESDLVGNFSSLTGGTVGAAGSTMTWSYLAAAVSILRGNKVPGPYYAVLHPYQVHDLSIAVSNMTQATGQMNAPGAGDAALANRMPGAPLGLAGIIESAEIAIDGNADAFGAVCNPLALALDTRRAPRLEPERDASRRGIELNLSAVYAHGVWRPAYGVAVLSDATTPA